LGESQKRRIHEEQEIRMQRMAKKRNREEIHMLKIINRKRTAAITTTTTTILIQKEIFNRKSREKLWKKRKA